MIELLIIVGIILVIVCLITRDRTEYKLMRLRSGVINSRAQKQRLVHIYKRIESLVLENFSKRKTIYQEPSEWLDR